MGEGEAHGFGRAWTAEVLKGPPMIAPTRQYTWPMRVAGEEEALARGALLVMVRPNSGGSYLVTCALGFSDPALPSGVWGCPDEGEICAVAGGYGYVARVELPEECAMIGLKPVVEVIPVLEAGLLLFVGFHRIVAWGCGGVAWETGRLSWEGVRVVSIGEGELVGLGWDMVRDLEVEFRVDLKTGGQVGGGLRSW